MKSTTKKGIAKKKRGRPATGRDPVITMRLAPNLTARLDAWAANKGISRSDAIRDMIEVRLSQQPSGKPHKGAAKAKDMAKAALNERLKDLPDDERITRKAQLLKGPNA